MSTTSIDHDGPLTAQDVEQHCELLAGELWERIKRGRPRPLDRQVQLLSRLIHRLPHFGLVEAMAVEEFAAIADEICNPDIRRCRVCTCTDLNGCACGCWWVAEDLCSRCSCQLSTLDPNPSTLS